MYRDYSNDYATRADYVASYRQAVDDARHRNAPRTRGDLVLRDFTLSEGAIATVCVRRKSRTIVLKSGGEYTVDGSSPDAEAIDRWFND